MSSKLSSFSDSELCLYIQRLLAERWKNGTAMLSANMLWKIIHARRERDGSFQPLSEELASSLACWVPPADLFRAAMELCSIPGWTASFCWEVICTRPGGAAFIAGRIQRAGSAAGLSPLPFERIEGGWKLAHA